jgi:uncharacterized delta-60 repeat protein
MKRAVVVILLSVVLAYPQIVEWLHRYPGYGSSSGEDIAVDGAGNVYVAGWGGTTSNAFDYLTIKYSGSGDTLWVRYYDGGASHYDYGNAMAIDDMGNVYVTGRSITSGTQYDIATLKYNSSGVLQWAVDYAGAYGDDDEGNDVAVDDSGYVYMTGSTYSLSTSNDYITIKYDSDGDTVWTARFDGPDNSSDIPTAIALDGQGNVYVTGYAVVPGEYFNFTTIKYNASGEEQWVASYDGLVASADDKAYDIECYGDYVYVTGVSEGANSEDDFMTIKYDNTGDTVWTARYDGPAGESDEAFAVAVDNNGNVYATGESFGDNTSQDYLTLKYTSVGSLEWAARYNGPDSSGDGATAIAVDNMGNVYVTGNSYADDPYTPENDYLTVKYNSSGSEEWNARYDGTGHTQDYAKAITVDNAGYVYVTGSSIGTTSYNDVVTIKYTVVGIDEEAGYAAHGAGYNLSASPNPFSKLTTVSFGIEHSAERIELSIFDAAGRLVRNLYRAMPLAPCNMQITWDGTDRVGRQLGSGVYFVRLEAGDHHETRRLLLVR